MQMSSLASVSRPSTPNHPTRTKKHPQDRGVRSLTIIRRLLGRVRRQRCILLDLRRLRLNRMAFVQLIRSLLVS